MADTKEVTIVIKGKNLSDADFAAARRNITGLGDETTRASSHVGLLGGTMRTAIGTFGGFLSAQAVMGAVGGAFRFAKGAAIDMNSSLEKSTLQFGTLMGDSQRAEKHVRDLFEFAKKTPFETGPIIQASRHMQTFGGDALNTMGNLTLLGDAAAATGAPIEDLGFWVGRMFAALKGGQPIGEATMRLMELGVLTPQTRVQMEALAKSAGGGEKAFKLFQDSLGGFSGAMVAQANTWEGLMSSISDAVNITLADSLKPFFELVKEGAQIALQVLGSDGVGKAFTDLKNSIGFSLGGDTTSIVKAFISNILTVGDGFLAVAGIAERVFNFQLNSTRAVVYGLAAGFLSLAGAAVSSWARIAEGASMLPGVGDKFKGIAQNLRGMSDTLESAATNFGGLALESLAATTQQSTLNKAIEGSRGVLQAVRASVDGYTKSAEQNAVAVKKQADALGGGGTGGGASFTAQLAAAQREVAGLTTKQREQIDAGVRLGASEKELAKAVGVTEEAIKLYKKQLSDTADWTKKLADNTFTLQEAIGKGLFGKLTTEIGNAPELFSKPILNTLQQLPKAVQASGVPKSLASSLFSGFKGESGVLANLGQTIVGAFQGGGNVLKTIGGTVGSQLGTNVVTRFGSSITGLLGQTLGGALNSILPGVGALLGPLMGKVGGFFKSLFGGISPEVKAARQEVDAFQVKLADTLTVTQRNEAGNEKWKMTVIAVRDAYLATGRTAGEAEAIVRQLWDTNRPDRAKAAMQQINAVLDEQKQKFAQINALQEELTGLQGQTVVTTEQMREAAQRYGIDLAGLGPAFQSGRLHQSAQEIWNDFRLLERGGADVGAVLFGMKDEIINLADESVRFGVQIPANFRPLIENLLQSNDLTEEERQKLQALGAENFGDPIVAKLDAIATKIGELIDRIAAASGGLNTTMPAAAANAAGTIEREFRGRAIPALVDTADAIDGVIEMHSPTGLMGIAHYAGLAAGSIEDMAGRALPPIGVVRDHTNDIARVLEVCGDNVTRLSVLCGEEFPKMGKGVTDGFQAPIAATRHQLQDLLNQMKFVPGSGTPGGSSGGGSDGVGRGLLTEAEAIGRVNARLAARGLGPASGELLRALAARFGGNGNYREDLVDQFLNELENIAFGNSRGRVVSFASGTRGDFPDHGRGRPAFLHGREAVTPYEERVPTARRWLAEAGAVAAAAAITVQVYVGVDPQSGRVRLLGEHERRQVQQWLYDGAIDVPAAAVVQRGR